MVIYSPIEIASTELVDKETIRGRVWQYLEVNHLARFPTPVAGRIPNFENSDKACDRLLNLEEFQRAQVVKVNPDKPQERARFHVLNTGKTLLVPTPRLRQGLFNRILPPNRDPNTLRLCATSEGVKSYSKPLPLELSNQPLDLIIVGSVALSATEGYRIGKGEGYADLEFGALTLLGSYDPQHTTVVSIVHDCQLFEHLEPSLFKSHDFLVDIILTPTQTIRCDMQRQRETPGIIWPLLSEDRLDRMPVLRVLRDRFGC